MKKKDSEIQVLRNKANSATINVAEAVVPSLLRAAGSRAEKSTLEFFIAEIRNPRTRAAYLTAIRRFSDWAESRSLTLIDLEPIHLGAYVEQRSQEAKPLTVKQNLAAIRRFFDWLVMHRVLHINPAKNVRGVKHVARTGKTMLPDSDDVVALIESIPVETIVGLRDRALIGILLYSFARVSAAVGMNVHDYVRSGKKRLIRLSEKGGVAHQMPVHHLLEHYLDTYLQTAGLFEHNDSPLFRSSYRRTGLLTERRLSRQDAWAMIKRRCKQAGISTEVCCHSFRARGITSYLKNGGSLENAQYMAAHSNPSTTKLYDRNQEELTVDEVEKIKL